MPNVLMRVLGMFSSPVKPLRAASPSDSEWARALSKNAVLRLTAGSLEVDHEDLRDLQRDGPDRRSYGPNKLPDCSTPHR